MIRSNKNFAEINCLNQSGNTRYDIQYGFPVKFFIKHCRENKLNFRICLFDSIQNRSIKTQKYPDVWSQLIKERYQPLFIKYKFHRPLLTYLLHISTSISSSLSHLRCANNSNLFRVAAVLVIAAITITILILGKSFLIPLAWSLLIGLASFRMLNRYEKKYHIKRLFSSMIFVGMILLGIAVLFYFFYREIASIVKGMPSFSENLISTIQSLVNSLEDYGIHIPMIDQTQIHSWISGHMDVISKALMAFGKNIGTLFLVCVYLFYTIQF